MAPQPMPKTDAVVALINELNQGYAPSSFDLARLDTAIRNLGNADVAASQCFRGFYHALQGDLANTTKRFSMALGMEPNNPDVYMNYATSLLRLQQHEQALKMALECIAKGGRTLDAIHTLLLCAYAADDRAALDAWLPEYAKLAGKPHDVESWLSEDAEDEAELPVILKEAENEGYISLSKLKEELGI